jgi:hypothetical protein
VDRNRSFLLNLLWGSLSPDPLPAARGEGKRLAMTRAFATDPSIPRT